MIIYTGKKKVDINNCLSPIFKIQVEGLAKKR